MRHETLDLRHETRDIRRRSTGNKRQDTSNKMQDTRNTRNAVLCTLYSVQTQSTRISSRFPVASSRKRQGIRYAICFLLFAGILAAVQDALACGTCYASVDTPMTRGLNGAIFLLLGVLTFILSCFFYFIFSLVRRSKLAAKPL